MSVSVCVCMSACEHISGTAPQFCACYLWPWLGPPMASLRCVRPVYIRFYGCRHICTQWTVMEACRIVDTDAASDVIGTPANGPAASYLYWLRGILDDGGRRD